VSTVHGVQCGSVKHASTAACARTHGSTGRSIDAARGTSNGTDAAQAGDVLRFFRENGGQPQELSGLVKGA
jgi:hypothetical protein